MQRMAPRVVADAERSRSPTLSGQRMSTNYRNTFITASPESKAKKGAIPKEGSEQAAPV
jgi:hypothetical protein